MRSLEVSQAYLVHLPHIDGVHVAEAVEEAVVEKVEGRVGERKVMHCILVEFAPTPL